MMYNSTRSSDVLVTSAQAITRGIAGDGGLFVPDSFPPLTRFDFMELQKKDYASRAAFILSKYLTDFSYDEIVECTALAYNNNSFVSESVAPLCPLDDRLYMLELWHGPTCAFKDMALQIMPHLMCKSATKTLNGKSIVILVATSGDTGKAALEGFKDADKTRIIVFYPEDGVSPMQKLQMTTQEGVNVAVYGIRGNFDDAQSGVKAIFTDTDVSKQLDSNDMVLSSANSINIGRLLPQIIYYISAYCDLINKGKIKQGDSINIVVPTGNFGNILAAYYALKMGLPVNRLICASNRNRVLTDFINSGVYDKNRSFYTTSSPSMDILVSSNLERLLYHLSDNDSSEIRRLMEQLNKNGCYCVSDSVKSRINSLFEAGSCDDNETAMTINDVYKQYGYLCDPHTAVAVNVYKQYLNKSGDSSATVIASTASPYKFSYSVLQALGEKASKTDDFENMEKLHQLTGCEIPKTLKAISGKPIRFTDVCNAVDMKNVVFKTLNIDGQ